MTNFTTYYPPMHRPEVVSIKCPNCGRHANFRSSLLRTADHVDRPYFEKSKNFEAEYVKTRVGQWKYNIWYDPGLGKPLEQINDLPPSFRKQYPHCSKPEERGTVFCSSCGLRRTHRLNWPDGAYFQIEHKGKILWAYNREMANKILEFLKSPNRKKHSFYRKGPVGSWSWLRNLPTVFQTKKVTPQVVKKLEKLLG